MCIRDRLIPLYISQQGYWFTDCQKRMPTPGGGPKGSPRRRCLCNLPGCHARLQDLPEISRGAWAEQGIFKVGNHAEAPLCLVERHADLHGERVACRLPNGRASTCTRRGGVRSPPNRSASAEAGQPLRGGQSGRRAGREVAINGFGGGHQLSPPVKPASATRSPHPLVFCEAATQEGRGGQGIAVGFQEPPNPIPPIRSRRGSRVLAGRQARLSLCFCRATWAFPSGAAQLIRGRAARRCGVGRALGIPLCRLHHQTSPYRAGRRGGAERRSVSYTHLTLPTKA